MAYSPIHPQWRVLLPMLALTLISACAAAPTTTSTPAVAKAEVPAPTEPPVSPDAVQAFVEALVTQHGFDADHVNGVLGQAQMREDILRAISRPAEAKPWYEYRPIFVTRARTEDGVAFWKENAALLQQASERYGVDAKIIVSIIGVETRYGRITGNYRVLDALNTLGFGYPPRADFFRKELAEFFLLTREERIDPLTAKGSYAGAMGYGQFIPSSYRNYAVDFDGDGKRDLWQSMPDIIGSVANYFHRHGWQSGQPVTAQVKVSGERFREILGQGLEPKLTLAEMRAYGVEPPAGWDEQQPATLMEFETENGSEYWVGLKNFYVITRYNRSFRYAMSVYQLSEEIADSRGLVRDE